MGSSLASAPNLGMTAYLCNDARSLLNKWEGSGTPKPGGIAKRWKRAGLAWRRNPGLKNTHGDAATRSKRHRSARGRKWWIPGKKVTQSQGVQKDQGTEPQKPIYCLSSWVRHHQRDCLPPRGSRRYTDLIWRKSYTPGVDRKWKREKLFKQRALATRAQKTCFHCPSLNRWPPHILSSLEAKMLQNIKKFKRKISWWNSQEKSWDTPAAVLCHFLLSQMKHMGLPQFLVCIILKQGV